MASRSGLSASLLTTIKSSAKVTGAAGALDVIMDRAYEGNQTRQLLLNLGMSPVVPPTARRLSP